MALINCPECGKQISDKARICPHCGIDVPKMLAEVHEEQQRQKKKQRKRTFISLASILMVAGVAVLAYLYSIDALNTIPSEYRKLTEDYFDNCEFYTNSGDYKKGNEYLNMIEKRTLTQRQTKKLKRLHKQVDEMTVFMKKGEAAYKLQNIEEQIANNEFNYSETGMRQIKEDINTINAELLDSSQTERFRKAKEKYIMIQLGKMEEVFGLYKSQGNKDHYYLINKYAQDLYEMELSIEQKTKIDELVDKTDKLKKRQEEEQNKRKQLLSTIKDEYIRVISNDDCGSDYFLFDINGDKIPELWIKGGKCEAEFRELLVYTFDNSLKLLYSDDIGNATYYEYNDGIVQVQGVVDAYCELLTYNGRKIVSRELKGGNMESEGYLALTRGRRVRLYPSYNTQPIIETLGVR